MDQGPSRSISLDNGGVTGNRNTSTTRTDPKARPIEF